MERPSPIVRHVKLATLSTGLLAVLFLIFFNTSKHDPALAQANVFIDDPYDAVGSFGVQLGLLAALLSCLRTFRPYPQGILLGHLSLILRGDAVALLSVVVTLAADGVAMLRYLPAWTGSAAGWRLALLAGGLFAFTALAELIVIELGRRLGLLSGRHPWLPSIAVCLAGLTALALYPPVWRESAPGGIFTALVGMALLFVLVAVTVRLVFPPGGETAGDLIEDLSALYQWAKAHAGPAGFVFPLIERAVANPPLRAIIRWLDPRQHAWNLVILAGLGMGLVLVTMEMLAEGAPNRSLILLVLAVFMGIEGAGALLGYALFRQYLGIFR
jgi:hypothetical protein